MQMPEFEKGYEPKFNAGQKAWVINKKPSEDSVAAIIIKVMDTDNGPRAYCFGYQMTLLNRESLDAIYAVDDVYATKSEAQEATGWHPVTGISTEEWKRAIGDRKDYESIDSCELPDCCADISEIRDLLLQCQENGGLIQRDLRELRGLLEAHDCLITKGGCLDKIFEQLDVTDTVVRD